MRFWQLLCLGWFVLAIVDGVQSQYIEALLCIVLSYQSLTLANQERDR